MTTTEQTTQETVSYVAELAAETRLASRRLERQARRLAGTAEQISERFGEYAKEARALAADPTVAGYSFPDDPTGWEDLRAVTLLHAEVKAGVQAQKDRLERLEQARREYAGVVAQARAIAAYTRLAAAQAALRQALSLDGRPPIAQDPTRRALEAAVTEAERDVEAALIALADAGTELPEGGTY